MSWLTGYGRRLWPLRVAVVSGPSMVPTLRSGDVVIAYRGRVRVGDVVLAQFHSMPGRWVVKRASGIVADGWVLASDNPFAAGDSAVHGAAAVHARVLLRCRRWKISRVRRADAGTSAA